MSGELLSELRAVNFRSARKLTLQLGPVNALIGEPGTGKSNMLAAVHGLLDQGFVFEPSDVMFGERRFSIEGTLADGRVVTVDDRSAAPPIVAFPARLRDGDLVVAGADVDERAVRLLRRALEGSPAPRVALVRGLEACCAEVTGTVFTIEEPELFLTPQAHRYLYRLVHRLAEHGNQVLFTTHAPGLLNVAALEEVHLVSRDEYGVTSVAQMHALDVDDAFRAMCELDAARSELLLSRAAVLVEGLTEKVTMPQVFAALGADADRDQMSIVDCGGKSNIPLFVEICQRAGIAYVVVHDSDIAPGAKGGAAERRLNELIRDAAGEDRTIVLEPDFEAVAGLKGKSRKPERAWLRFGDASPEDIPEPLVRAVRLALEIARPGPPTYS